MRPQRWLSLALTATLLLAAPAKADSAPAPSEEDRVLAGLRQRLDAAVAQGIEQASPHVERLLYLQGGRKEARQAEQLIRPALKMLDDLQRDANATLEQWRTDWDKLATGAVQQVEDLLPLIEYRRAWVQYYLAVALGGELSFQSMQREALLREAADCAARYAEGDASTGIKYWALLLCGMAERELRHGDRAADCLGRAVVEAAEPAVRLQAQFELAKLRLEQGAWDEALKQADAYAGMASHVLGAEKGDVVDLHRTMLRYHVFRRQGAGEQAQQALLTFLTEHPQRQAWLIQVVADSVQDDGEAADLGSIALVAQAVSAMENDEAVRGVALLRDALARNDAAARVLRPSVLWHLATALMQKGQTQAEAGRLFAQLAREYPQDALALTAARNAAALAEQQAASLAQLGQPCEAAREEAVAAMELLLERWGARPEIADYAYRLAVQYRALGRREQALASLERVPAESRYASAAAFEALSLRQEMLGADVPAAERLLADLRAYSAGVYDRTAQAADADDAARGAFADLLAAHVLAVPLDRADEALAQLDQLQRRWPEQKEALNQADALRVNVLLEHDSGPAALDVAQRLQQRDESAGRQVVLAAATRILARTEALRDQPAQAEELARWRQALAAFAELACRLVDSQPASQQYPYKQMLAQAWMETGRQVDARDLFQTLAGENPTDAMNLQGLARCAWLMQDYAGALKRYQELLAGLDRQKHGKLWWRCQLELAQCGFEAAQDDAEQLSRLGVRLRQLRGQAEDFGGYLDAFKLLETQVQQRLARIGQNAN